MNEIICPHCNKAFKIDETGYADILRQVRDSDFEKQLHERLSWLIRTSVTLLSLHRLKLPMNCRRLPQPRILKSRN